MLHFCFNFILFGHTVMLIFILIDAQYSQKAVFSFERGSSRQNHSSSGSLHPIKKFPPVTFLNSLNPLPLFGRPHYIKLYDPFFCGWGATALRLYRATMMRQFTFYQKFLVLINSISEGWKTEMILKPSSGFELVYQSSYYQI